MKAVRFTFDNLDLVVDSLEPAGSYGVVGMVQDTVLEETQTLYIYPYPLSRQKTGSFKVDSSPLVKAVGTEGARRAATGVPTATPYISAGVR